MSQFSRRRFLTITASAALVPGMARAEAASRRVWRGVALGADVSITLEGPPVRTRAALARARLEIEAYEQRFSLYRAGSDIIRLNADGLLRDPDPVWRALLATCTQLHAATGGVFDPTIQPLWAALASGEDVDAARALVGWDRLRLPDATARAVRLGPGQALSLNGIAQGAATDAVCAALRAMGMMRVLVDIGETAALGGPWQIAARDPEHGDFAEFSLQDTACAVSTPGALRLSHGETHILHPRTAAKPLWASTAVHAQEAALADGLSTAACFLDLPALRYAMRALGGIHQITLLDHAGKVQTLRG